MNSNGNVNQSETIWRETGYKVTGYKNLVATFFKYSSRREEMYKTLQNRRVHDIQVYKLDASFIQ